MKKKVRIAKYLASCGILSRRKAEDLIKSEKIKVNGEIITDLSFKVGADDKVEYQDRELKSEKNIVIALNKPEGYISSVRDDYKRKTVLDLVNGIEARLYPVGRLDFDSRGLILLTNDGDFAYKILHPKFQIPKTYEVEINNYFSDESIEKITKGINIEGRKLLPDEVRILIRKNNVSRIEIKISEGRKRIIRKAFEKLGYKVKDLKRTAIGGLKLDNLAEGNFKILSEDEREKVFKS
ncbi:MAG: rRNA pseudouridine synthase [Actinobacteria bacterium]|nr:rRNA pseudouridine synthase [Actinomycetota bacterium]